MPTMADILSQMEALLAQARAQYSALLAGAAPAPTSGIGGSATSANRNPFSSFSVKAASLDAAKAQGDTYISQQDVGHSVADIVSSGGEWYSVTVVDDSASLTQYWLVLEADRLLRAIAGEQVTIYLPALATVYAQRQAARSAPVTPTPSSTFGTNGVGLLGVMPGGPAPAGATPDMPAGTILTEPDGTQYKKTVVQEMMGDAAIWMPVN